MRTTLFRLALGTAAAGGLWIALTQQPPPAQPLTVEKLAGDLHIIVGSGGNVAVYTTDEGVILVDAKFDRNVPEILEKVKGITDKPIRYVLNTHHHGDHTGGNATLIKTAEIVAHDNAVANMVRGKQPGVPRIAFTRDTVVRLGGKEVRMYHAGRAHTNGDAVALFPAHRVLHTGDMFVAGAPFADYNNGGSAAEWPLTILSVLRLDFERVIPGHGPVMAKADLQKFGEAFAAARGQITEMKKQGKTKDEVAAGFSTAGIPAWKPAVPNAPTTWRSAAAYYDELPAAGETGTPDLTGKWSGMANTIDVSGVKRPIQQTIEIRKGDNGALTAVSGRMDLKVLQEGNRVTLTTYITFEGGEYLRWYLEFRDGKLVGQVSAVHDSPKKWNVDWSGPVEFTRP